MSARIMKPSTAAALLGLVALIATPASASEVVLRFGSINTENTAAYDQVLLPFAKAVEEESEGRIEVALKPLGGYGKPDELVTMSRRARSKWRRRCRAIIPAASRNPRSWNCR